MRGLETITISLLLTACTVAMTGVGVKIYETLCPKPRLEVVAHNTGVCSGCGHATSLVIRERKGE